MELPSGTNSSLVGCRAGRSWGRVGGSLGSVMQTGRFYLRPGGEVAFASRAGTSWRCRVPAGLSGLCAPSQGDSAEDMRGLPGPLGAQGGGVLGFSFRLA